MGFMDSLMKGLKKAANEIDKAAGLSGNNSLGNLANQAQQSYNNAVGNTQTSAPRQSAPVSNGRRTPPNVLNSGNEPIAPYKTAEGFYYDGEDADIEVKATYEIPSDFEEFESHAEPEMCYLYKFDDSDYSDIDLNKPYICITPEFYDSVESFVNSGTVNGAISCEPVQIGKFFFKAKLNYRGEVVSLYGFKRGSTEQNMALAMFYNPDVVGTPLETKLISILDHAAQTYTETMV